MLTLAFTSSTGQVGVALADGDRVLTSAVSADDRRHAEDVTPLMVRVLTEAGVEVGQVERLAVDVGPGRFTGLRVGLATVRGLAVATGCAVVGISSLELLARAEPDDLVAAVVDARRREVFQQVWGADGPRGEPLVGLAADVVSLVPEGAVIVGDGADRYPDVYGPIGERRAGREPSPEVLAVLAADRAARPARDVAPLYLREPDVQVNIRTRP